jgi:CheY-like chemotaxis protein
MEKTSMTEKQKAKKILVVDDEPGIVTYLETLLQDNGYETVSAADGQAGLEKVTSERPDLITLDISMPETSGIRLYRNLKENPDLAKIPVVIVTGVTGKGGNPEEFKKFISTRKQVPPPEGFVPKPIDQEELLSTISSLLS